MRLFSLMLCFALIAACMILTGAEGSRELNGNGGWRAFSEWQSGNIAGVLRHQVIKVYAYAGETIRFGSSVYDSRLDITGTTAAGAATNIDIVVLNPLGVATAYNVLNAGAMTGYISTRTQEMAGPRYTVGGHSHNPTGYVPFSIAVTQTGVYEFHFHSQQNNTGNPTAIAVTGAPAQGTAAVAFWDVTVTKTSTADPTDVVEVPGRAFTNYLSLNTGNNDANHDWIKAKVYVLTNDGYVYSTDLNGMDPYGFLFFSNNRGLVSTTTDAPLYVSYKTADSSLSDLETLGATFQKPTATDTSIDKTYKIFFENPSDDLPSTIKQGKALAPSKVENFRFVGYDNAKGYVGHGGYFYFNVKNASSARIEIDLSHYKGSDGVWRNGGKVYIDNAVVEGENCFEWNGLDANKNVVAAGTYGEEADGVKVTITTKAGEYHFPVFDAETNRNGIKIRLESDIYDFDDNVIEMTEAERCTIYYNHTGPTMSGVTGHTGLPPNNDANATNGTNSENGASTYTGNNTTAGAGGNCCALDIWTYFKAANAPSTSQVEPFTLEEVTNKGNIKGFVFFDRNNNGVYKLSESDVMLQGITVQLYNSTGTTLLKTTTTDALGRYAFMGYDYASYQVKVVKPSSIYTLTTSASGGTETQNITISSGTVDAQYSVYAKDVGYNYIVTDKALSIQKIWTVDRAVETSQPVTVDIDIVGTYTIGATNYTETTTVTLSAVNNWREVLTTLPKYHNQGGTNYLITYSVDEADLGSDYVSTVTYVNTYTEWQYTVTNTPKGMIVLTKEDSTTHAHLEDAVFRCWQGDGADGTADDTLLGTYTTNGSGHISVNVPVETTYYFEEIRAPLGYSLPANTKTADISVTFTAGGSVSYVTVSNTKYAVDMTLTKKLDAASEQDQEFRYKINTGTKTLYAVLTVKAGATTVTQKINYLDTGTYTVTELTSNWRYAPVPASTTATNGTNTYNYNAATRSLTMAMTDPHNKNYAFTFTNTHSNSSWISASDSVVNTMVPPT